MDRMARPNVEFTVEDYLSLPDHVKAQVIEGDLVMNPAPDPLHARVVQRLLLRLCDHLGPDGEDRVLTAPVDVFIDRINVLQPDLLVFAKGTVATEPKWKIPLPIWVAEVLSPSTAHYDRGTKLKVYRRAGVREAWLVDHRKKTIVVHGLPAETRQVLALGETAESGVIPGFRVGLEELFAIRGSRPA